MKRLELFKHMCELTDALEKVTCVLLAGTAARNAWRWTRRCGMRR